MTDANQEDPSVSLIQTIRTSRRCKRMEEQVKEGWIFLYFQLSPWTHHSSNLLISSVDSWLLKPNFKGELCTFSYFHRFATHFRNIQPDFLGCHTFEVANSVGLHEDAVHFANFISHFGYCRFLMTFYQRDSFGKTRRKSLIWYRNCWKALNRQCE